MQTTNECFSNIEAVVYINLLSLRVIHLTESRLPNKYDRTKTATNHNSWTWPKLKPTNLISNRHLQAGLPVRVKLMFVCVMLMFVSVMNFGQVQKIRFVVVEIFWLNSNQFLVILIRSSELASLVYFKN